jgi:hypothetical protein
MFAHITGRKPMFRISLPWILDVVAAIDGLSAIKKDELKTSHSWHLLNAKSQMGMLFSQSIYAPYLKISRERAETLNTCLTGMTAPDPDQAAQWTEIDIWYLQNCVEQFKTVFWSELSILPSFLVAGKESYDSNTLLDEGFKLFPQSLSTKAPESIRDAMQAGRALAFELATACGFHTFRLTEAVIKRYWDQVSSKAPRPKLETIGNYAAELEKNNFGDNKIWESLKQMAKLHRNPLIHPEVILTVEEAIETLGIARSVIGAMLRALPDVPPTTGSPALPGPIS